MIETKGKIDVEELMPGNYIRHKGVKNYTRLTAYDLYKYAHYLEGDYEDAFYSSFEPIKIDAWWLRKFGFFDYKDGFYDKVFSKESMHGEIVKICSFSYMVVKSDSDFSINIEYNNNKEGENIESHYYDLKHLFYIHQLQNAYYFLTGTKLTL